MAFTREVWNKIHLCSENFCQFDDYNWDWSLFHVSMTCLKQKLHVMLIKGPRVFHIGEWYRLYAFNYFIFMSNKFLSGVHHKKSHCDSDAVIDKLQTILKTASPYFFPDRYC